MNFQSFDQTLYSMKIKPSVMQSLDHVWPIVNGARDLLIQ